MGGKQSKGKGTATKTSHKGALVTTLYGHKDAVMCCAFSPDGKYLATSSADRSVVIWDASSFKKRHRLENEHSHTDTVTAVCFSPDSSLLISAGKDCRVVLWDPRSGMFLQKARRHQAGILHCDFSRDDNRMFATASEDKTVGIWEIQGPRMNRTEITGHKSVVFQVCFSSDNVTLASCSNDRTIMLWNRRTGKRLAKFKDLYSRVMTCKFSPDGTLLAAVVEGERVRIWNAMRGDVVNVLEGHHTQPILSCTFSPDGNIIATGSGDKTFALWKASAVRKLPDYHAKAHESWIQSVAFSPDGHYLATASSDRTVHVWVANP